MNLELQPRIDANRNLMGISNTLVRGFPPLTHVKEDLSEILSGVQELVYVPYAYGNMDKIIDILTPSFKEMGVKTIRSPHQFPNHETEVILDAEAIFIGGGNTGRLVANLWALRNHDGSLVDQRLDASVNSIVDSIREKAAKGVAVIGSSAGLNVMCRDVRATNDMQAAVQIMNNGSRVLRIDGLSLLPQNLSVNPHFQDNVVVTDEEREKILAINPKLRILTDHQGETRTERLTQLLEMDNNRTVLALREGSYILVNGMKMELRGNTGGIIFEYGKDQKAVNSGDKLDQLLRE
jgi:dipeptidase E